MAGLQATGAARGIVAFVVGCQEGRIARVLNVIFIHIRGGYNALLKEVPAAEEVLMLLMWGLYGSWDW